MSATPIMEATAPETLEVVLAFSSLEDYRRMGADIAAARAKLGLPKWAAPAEVIAAALRAAL